MERRTVPSNSLKQLPVINSAGDDLGRIEEVMIDLVDGSIAYLVLSYGGIFGTTLADKRFAVPYDAFRYQRGEDGKSSYLLDVDQAFLESAPGIDKDNWPDFASPQFDNALQGHQAGLRDGRAA